MNREELNAVKELLDFTTTSQLRKTVTKLFFLRRENVANAEDEENVFFLLNFLENLNEKKSPE